MINSKRLRCQAINTTKHALESSSTTKIWLLILDVCTYLTDWMINYVYKEIIFFLNIFLTQIYIKHEFVFLEG